MVGSEDGLISGQPESIIATVGSRCESMCHWYADRALPLQARAITPASRRYAMQAANRRRGEFLLDDEERPAFVIDRVMRKVVGILWSGSGR